MCFARDRKQTVGGQPEGVTSWLYGFIAVAYVCGYLSAVWGVQELTLKP